MKNRKLLTLFLIFPSINLFGGVSMRPDVWYMLDSEDIPLIEQLNSTIQPNLNGSVSPVLFDNEERELNRDPFDIVHQSLAKASLSQSSEGSISQDDLQGILSDEAVSAQYDIDQGLFTAATLLGAEIPGETFSSMGTRLSKVQEIEQIVFQQMYPNDRKRLEYIVALLTLHDTPRADKTFEKETLIDMKVVGSKDSSLQGNLFPTFTHIGRMALAQMLVVPPPIEEICKRQATIERMYNHAIHPVTSGEFGPSTMPKSAMHALNIIRGVEDLFLSLYASLMPAVRDPIQEFMEKNTFKLLPELNQKWLAFSFVNLWQFGADYALSMPFKRTGTVLGDIITIPGISKQQSLEYINNQLGGTAYFEQFHTLVVTLFLMKKKLIAVFEFIKALEYLKEYANKIGFTELANKLQIDRVEQNKEKFAQFRQMLEVSTCNNYREFFSHLGKIMVAYQSVASMRDSFIEAYEAAGELDALVAIVDSIINRKSAGHPFAKVSFDESLKAPIQAEYLYNPYRPKSMPCLATSATNVLQKPCTIITGIQDAGKTFFLRSLSGNILLALTLGYASGRNIIVKPLGSILASFSVLDRQSNSDSTARAQRQRIADLTKKSKLSGNQPAVIVVDEPFSGSGQPVLFLEPWFKKIIQQDGNVSAIISTSHGIENIPQMITNLSLDAVEALKIQPFSRQLEKNVVTLEEIRARANELYEREANQ